MANARDFIRRSATLATLVGAVALSAGCGSKSSSPSGSAGASGGARASGGAGAAGSAGTGGAGTGAAGAAGTSSDAGAGTTGASGQGGMPVDAGGDVVSFSGPCAPFANADQPAAKLSDTGCMDKNNPTKLASIVVPYEVNSPLWSDNANKERGFVIPQGSKIHVKNCATASAECMQGPADTGKWVMPVGTVMVKSFSFDGKVIETRLLMHPDAATWNGYSYQWNEAQTEATVVPADDDPTLNNMRLKISFNTGMHTIDWTFPYRFDCNTCHTDQAGGTLGPETRQMNRTVGGMNQIDKWATAGYFEGAGPPKPYQAALTLPVSGQLGTVDPMASKQDRARSYLHANCAYCHRPDDLKVNWIDFRYDTSLKDTGTCNVMPMKGVVANGPQDSMLLTPGNSMKSVIWARMHSPRIDEKTRMPQIATYVVDDMGTQVVADWIDSLTACP